VAECDYGTWSEECGCPEHHVPSCWPVPLVSCCDDLTITPQTPPERVAVIERSMRMAVELLHALSGRQFGLCPRTVRPCRDACQDTVDAVWVDGQLRPMLMGGQWYNDPCGTCKTDCSCTEICEVTLPGPVERIIRVRLDGAEVEPLDYRVDNHRKLVALNGLCWPTCQDMNASPLEGGSFEVTYLRGKPVPETARYMAGLVACELVVACTPSAGDCKLPDNVTSVVRQGVELDLSPLILGTGGRTGIPEVDLWLKTVNPTGTYTRSRVYSPDRKLPRRRTDCVI
jgi:hypothetical protein